MLEARPLPGSPDFPAFGGAYVVCYQRPGLAADPVRHAGEFLREQGWQVTGVEEEPEQIGREDAPDAEPFDTALQDDEAYVFHQWPVDDAEGETRH